MGIMKLVSDRHICRLSFCILIAINRYFLVYILLMFFGLCVFTIASAEGTVPAGGGGGVIDASLGSGWQSSSSGMDVYTEAEQLGDGVSMTKLHTLSSSDSNIPLSDSRQTFHIMDYLQKKLILPPICL